MIEHRQDMSRTSDESGLGQSPAVGADSVVVHLLEPGCGTKSRLDFQRAPGMQDEQWESDRTMEIDEAMAVGAARYADALEELRRFGPAVFTQTGGMCAALEVTLERGMLLVTDAEDSLSWWRGEQLGWGVGFYRSSDAAEGPEVFTATDDTSTEALVFVVEQCLREAASAFSSGGA